MIKEMFRVSQFIQVFAMLSCLSALSESKAAPEWYPKDLTQPESPAEISFNRGAGHGDSLYIVLQSETSEDLLFGLDTGSPVTILDKSLEAKIGKKLSTMQIPTGWFGKMPTSVYAPPKLFLGKTPLVMGENVWTEDLSRMSPGHQMIGILGMDCLHHYCLQLDFVAHKISFLRPDAPEANQGMPFPLKISRVGVEVQTSFITTNETKNGIDSAEYLDGSLGSNQFQQALKEHPDALVQQWTNSTGTILRQARFASANFGGGIYTNVIVREHSNGENTIGLHLLARHLVTFNFPKQTLYLRKLP